ncbi:MAG TPA: DUF2203 domain-containing protein [Symbiobacteriaceae bacterium]|jgi:hypothetical protein
MAERQFTPLEVNRMIPELERIMKYLRSLEGEIQEKEWKLKQAKVEASREGNFVDESTFLKEEAEIDFQRILVQGQFERVRELGGEIKGGYLVDFPSRIDGHRVLLCWKPGEQAVAWYHGPYEGMMGRKPIPGKFLKAEQSDGTTEDA